MNEVKENIIINQIIYIINSILVPSKIYLFGSRANGRYRKGSDFDIAIDSEKPSINVISKIQEKLEEVSGLYSVDIVYHKSVDKEFKDIVINSGEVIYERRS